MGRKRHKKLKPMVFGAKNLRGHQPFHPPDEYFPLDGDDLSPIFLRLLCLPAASRIAQFRIQSAGRCWTHP